MKPENERLAELAEEFKAIDILDAILLANEVIRNPEAPENLKEAMLKTREKMFQALLFKSKVELVNGLKEFMMSDQWQEKSSL
jgi:hypothetical protein